MPSLNKVMIIGNAGADAEMRYTESGTAIATWSVAVNYKAQEKDQTEWFNCVMFGEKVERVAPHILKGKPLFVEGRLQTRSWSDDQGQKHYRTEVVAFSVQFLGSREETLTERLKGDIDVDDLPFE